MIPSNVDKVHFWAYFVHITLKFKKSKLETYRNQKSMWPCCREFSGVPETLKKNNQKSIKNMIF